MKIEDIKFNITGELSNTLLELLVIKQMLKENQLNKKDLLLLTEYYQVLKSKFIKLFKDTNKKEIELYKKLTNLDK